MDTSPGLLELVLDASEGEQMLLLALLGGAVFMVVLAILFAADRKPDPVKNRVLAMQKADEQPSSTPSLSRKEDSFFARMSYLFMPRGQQARKFTVGRLQLAGFRSLSAFATYYTIRSTLMVVLDDRATRTGATWAEAPDAARPEAPDSPEAAMMQSMGMTPQLAHVLGVPLSSDLQPPVPGESP